MERKFVICVSFISCFDYHRSKIYFHDLDNIMDTRGMYGFDSITLQSYVVPYTKLELVKYFGKKIFYTRSELCFNSNHELISIKNGNSFLPINHRDRKYSIVSQREINKLMKDNFS